MGDDPPACRNIMEQEEDCGLLSCDGGWTGLCYTPGASAPACPHRYIPSPPTSNTARRPPPQPSLPRGGSSSCSDVGATTPVQVVPWIGHGCCQQLPCHAWNLFHGRSCSAPMCIHIPKATGFEARRMLLRRMRLPRQASAAIGPYDDDTARPARRTRPQGHKVAIQTHPSSIRGCRAASPTLPRARVKISQGPQKAGSPAQAAVSGRVQICKLRTTATRVPHTAGARNVPGIFPIPEMSEDI